MPIQLTTVDPQTQGIVTTVVAVETTTEEHGKTSTDESVDTTTERSADTTTVSATDTTIQSATDTTTQATVLLSSSGNSNRTCPCKCRPIAPATNFTEEEINEKVVDIKKNLTLDKKTLTRSKIRKICIKDDRPSAKAVGAIGIAFFALFGVLIVLFDINFYLSLFNMAKSFVGQLFMRK